MNKNKYLLLGSSIGVLLLLGIAAIQETFAKEWRKIQAMAQSDEGPIPVQLRQIVNTNLSVSDRCVSCHVTMGPGEQSVRGHALLTPHKPVVHDPAEYGCTVCHGGQGLATEKADAHGDVHFWPEPMIGKSMSYAGCGTCHSPLGVPERNRYKQAQLAAERLDCLSCHRVDGRGGTIRPGGGSIEGPDLSRAGLKGYDSAWYDKHAAQAEKAPDGAWKTFTKIGEEDQALLKIWLATRTAAPQLVEAKSIFLSQGCLGCHKAGASGGDDGPDLSRAGKKDPGQVDFQQVPGARTMSNWMIEHFQSPASVVTGSLMPAVALSRKELEALTLFTLSLRRQELRDIYLPKDRVRSGKFGEREFASDGATIFGAFCSGCHGVDGEGRRLAGLVSFPSIANPDFLAIASDQFLERTVRDGRPGRRMPGWLKDGGLKADEIRAAIAHLRSMGAQTVEADSKPGRWISADAAAGRNLFARACSGCHGDEGKGAEGPALNNKVLLDSATDTYLVETIARGRRGTAMASFLEASPVRPVLLRADIEAIVAYLRSLQGGKS